MSARAGGRIRIGSHELDTLSARLVGTPEVPLTEIEASVLAYLHRQRFSVCSREQLKRDVWGYAATVQSRAVDALLLRLRRKLPEGISIRTIRGRGVQLVAKTPSAGREPLVGRRALLEELAEHLTAPGLVNLWGPPGIGKTALVHALDAHFVRSRGIENAAHERSDTGVLVVDHANTCQDGMFALAKLWAQDQSVVWVTHDRHSDADWDLRVPPLGAHAATGMLSQRTGLPEERLADLARAADGVPASIEILARAIHLMGLEATANMPASGLVQKGAEHIIEGLSDAEREVLGAAAFFETSFDAVSLGRVMDRAPFRLQALLDRLWSTSLLQRDDGLYRMLAPVRESVEGLPPEARQGAYLRLCQQNLLDYLCHPPRWMRHGVDVLSGLEHADDPDLLLCCTVMMTHRNRGLDIESALQSVSMREGRTRPAVSLWLGVFSVLRVRLPTDWITECQVPLGPIEEEFPRRVIREVLATYGDEPYDGPPSVELLTAFTDDVRCALSTVIPDCCFVQEYTFLRDTARSADERGWKYGAMGLHNAALAVAIDLGHAGVHEHGPKAGPGDRVAYHLRFAGVDEAIRVAEQLYEQHPEPHVKGILSGMLALVHLGRGAFAEAAHWLRTQPLRSIHQRCAQAILEGGESPIEYWGFWFDLWKAGTPRSASIQNAGANYAVAWTLENLPYARVIEHANR